MTRENKIYRRLYPIVMFFFGLLWRPKVIGAEHIPTDVAFIAYGNHTSNVDPFLMMYATGRNHQLHILAKDSLFRVPILGAVMRMVGMISVDRNINDIKSVRESLNYLKNGENLGIFPEGTRVGEDEDIEAKAGVAKIAHRTGAPVLPMYIPAKKRIFRRTPVVIGAAYRVSPDVKRLPAEAYAQLAMEMMEKLQELKP